MSPPVLAFDDADGLRRDDTRAQPVNQTKLAEDVCRIWRKLNTRADFLEPRRLFEDHHAKSRTRERQRGGQAADPGSGDDDGAGTGHWTCLGNSATRALV